MYDLYIIKEEFNMYEIIRLGSFGSVTYESLAEALSSAKEEFGWAGGDYRLWSNYTNQVLKTWHVH